MVIFSIVLMTSMFTCFNLKKYNFDYMNPVNIFCIVFLLSELICLSNVTNFAIKFHWTTFFVLLFSMTLFTFLSRYIYKNKKKGLKKNKVKLKKIVIDKKILIALIILQVLTIIAFIVYLYNITDYYNTHFAYDGKIYGFSNMIKLYDTLTKFWVDTFLKIKVSIPLVYRIGNPITYGCALTMIYIVVNNYIVEKKVHLLEVVPIILLCINIYINGSRSPIFRLLTMAIILYYILSRFNSEKKISRKQNIKFVIVVGLILIVFGILMVCVMSLIGRKFTVNSLNEYVFTYIGAPLVNFDNYIAKNGFKSHTWLLGAQSLKSMYNYIGKWTHNNTLLTYPTINVFTYSNNGIEIGNVYTTFYPWVYDLGVFGLIFIIPLILYYVYTYRDVSTKKVFDGMSFKLFLYSYLFNDLIMLVFSNRFYETVFDPGAIKLMIFAFLFIQLCINKNYGIINWFKAKFLEIRKIYEKKIN